MEVIMNAVEFYTRINNGKIEVPLQYQNSLGSDVKVIILNLDYNDVSYQNAPAQAAKGFGALAHRANPSLWDAERNALERAVVEKYAID
jgi:hypothetical protein